eukprot:CAMPEP_0170248228 /NCGR_PEP_ID=MMETSP0116_2-20130129/23907_1 /TAXON_ID=400756 /ORGANISM="Durinskia baltica, Strain CSIRO CS-38" /LENGTH=186 /DNA_ID=CAMNT_0010499117 /DNA_START=147 /DNA_END=706 /DNA_ORIENTATION=+
MSTDMRSVVRHRSVHVCPHLQSNGRLAPVASQQTPPPSIHTPSGPIQFQNFPGLLEPSTEFAARVANRERRVISRFAWPPPSSVRSASAPGGGQWGTSSRCAEGASASPGPPQSFNFPPAASPEARACSSPPPHAPALPIAADAPGMTVGTAALAPTSEQVTRQGNAMGSSKVGSRSEISDRVSGL